MAVAAPQQEELVQDEIAIEELEEALSPQEMDKILSQLEDLSKELELQVADLGEIEE